MTSAPPVTRASLLASSTVFPHSMARSTAGSPAMPTTATSTASTSSRAQMSSSASSPKLHSQLFSPAKPSGGQTSAAAAGENSRTCAASAAALDRAASAAAQNDSGCRRMTSRLCVPMDPVLPRIAILRMSSSFSRQAVTSSTKMHSATELYMMPSMRSSRPPWPGKILPKSLTPQMRLI